MGFQETIDWYNANAQTYAESLERIPSTELLDVFAARVGKGGKIVDAGCAAGRDTHLLQERGLHPVGVDVSESLLEIAKRKYPNSKFIRANFLELPFDDLSFDGIWANASLVHLETVEDVRKAIAEFYRILKVGGVVHISVKQQQGQNKTEVVSDTLSQHHRFFRWFTKHEINDVLEKTGFTVELIEDNIKDSAGRDEVQWITLLARK